MTMMTFFQMHFHQKSVQFKSSGGIKILLVILILQAVAVSANAVEGPTQEEINEAMNEVNPSRYCGRRLTDAMKVYCTSPYKDSLKGPVKKSGKKSD